DGDGAAMPEELRSWPWKKIKLITFGSPRAGDETWARLLTTKGLESDFFSSLINPLDSDALGIKDPSILARLQDTTRPAGFRVLTTTAPIPAEKLSGGGKHVGKPVYVNTPRLDDLIGPPDFGAHEPAAIRKYMVDGLADPAIPPVAWRYRDMKELNPERDES